MGQVVGLEYFERHLQNDGAQIWAMGFKMGELEGDPFLHSKGGSVELLGGIWNGGTPKDRTAFGLVDTDASLIGVYSRFVQQDATVKETAAGTTRALFCKDQCPERTWIYWNKGKGSVQRGFHVPFFRSAHVKPTELLV